MCEVATAAMLRNWELIVKPLSIWNDFFLVGSSEEVNEENGASSVVRRSVFMGDIMEQ